MTTKKVVIKASDRHTIRSIKTAMQGDIIRALVELITNSDDSYIRLEENGLEHCGKIEILYKKEGNICRFGVRDLAEGMAYSKIDESFTEYGAATSGLQSGESVRGYFGQGAKDALLSMFEGVIYTFNNNEFVECHLYIENDRPIAEIKSPIKSLTKLRKKYSIDNNGTIAYFKANKDITDLSIPRLSTVQDELANNYLLRKIMSNSKRKIYLIDEKTNRKIRIKYLFPSGEKILTDEFQIKYGSYESFDISLSLYKHEDELIQSGDNRNGGILIVDDKNVVLDLTLFKYDNEPLASKFFGELYISNFRELLKKEEPVLKEERTGLDTRHQFCKLLIHEVEKRLEVKINEERLKKQQKINHLDIEESRRYQKAFKILNDIAEKEVQDITNLGKKDSDIFIEPPDGFCLFPKTANITIGKKYNIRLDISKKIVPTWAEIKINSSNSKIKVITKKVIINSEDRKEKEVIRKFITIEGLEANIKGSIIALYKDRITESKIFVQPEEEFLYDEGMVFQPESITLSPNKSRKVKLLVYTKIIETGSIIKIKSDNNTVKYYPEEIIVNEVDAVRNITKYELEIWGEKTGENAEIDAEYSVYLALLDVKVTSKEKKQDQSSYSGMFNEPYFNSESNPHQRTSYSTKTGLINIYQNFPSIKFYLGNNLQYRKSMPSQVLIADLVAEQCFKVIAQKKIDRGGILFSPEAKQARIERDTYELSKKYGLKLHQALVDQELLKRSKEE